MVGLAASPAYAMVQIYPILRVAGRLEVQMVTPGNEGSLIRKLLLRPAAKDSGWMVWLKLPRRLHNVSICRKDV